MTAHRVGVWSALIAVAVLSLELTGAIAWKHHAVAGRAARWQSLRGTELTLGTVHRLDAELARLRLHFYEIDIK